MSSIKHLINSFQGEGANQRIAEITFLNNTLLESLFHSIVSDSKELHQNKLLNDKPNS